MSAHLPVILLIGKNGQVGWELERSLMPIGRVVAVDRKLMDLRNADAIRETIQQHKPNIIVNAAAYTAVDKAEQEVDLAMQVNAVALGVMAEEAKKQNALLVHYSTDYVFDGTKLSAYTESDEPNPINAYGKSKLAGEQAIQNVNGHYIILRTSWVYGLRGSNFLLTMLNLMKERQSLSVVSDQIGTPTWSRLIAEISIQVINQAWMKKKRGDFTSGLYHLTASGETSWYEFASTIADIALAQGMDLKIANINPIHAADYSTPAKRPLNSRLSLNGLVNQYDVNVPNWREALRLCMGQ